MRKLLHFRPERTRLPSQYNSVSMSDCWVERPVPGSGFQSPWPVVAERVAKHGRPATAS